MNHAVIKWSALVGEESVETRLREGQADQIMFQKELCGLDDSGTF